MSRVLPRRVQETLGSTILRGVDLAIVQRWDAAKARAARTSGGTIDEKVAALARAFATEMAAVGAVSGATAAVPGIGTAAALSAGVADVGWVTYRSTELILTVAAVHGHHRAGVDERRAWVLAILSFGSGAAAGFDELAAQLGEGVGAKATNALPVASLKRINTLFGRTIVSRYGSKRGVIALGRALPLGIGAAVGGTANFATTHRLARHAARFFAELPYSHVIETSATEWGPPSGLAPAHQGPAPVVPAPPARRAVSRVRAALPRRR